MNMDWLIGEHNNFQQYWQENTEEEMHQIDSSVKHRHIHLDIQANTDNAYSIKLYLGRDKSQLLSKHVLFRQESDFYLDEELLISTDNGLFGTPGFIKFNEGSIQLSGLGLIDECSSEPYVLLPCRYFSGWIQYPPKFNEPDELYSLRDLEIHDQGGYVELDIEGVDYTAELTQLVYAKRLRIMKLAIYDMPLKDVEINSKAICYTWVNPEAKRIGINIRKVISGWTLIEPDYVNSNNLNT